jgi:hypothetical protein
VSPQARKDATVFANLVDVVDEPTIQDLLRDLVDHEVLWDTQEHGLGDRRAGAHVELPIAACCR